MPVRRADSPEEWLAVCYTDQPIITQLDDGDGNGRGYVSSSASMPTTVAMMLDALHLDAGMRVLEIGTGTGYNAALLASRTGAENVTSVEVDPAVAEAAAAALKATGWPVRVVTADGTGGHSLGAPYDRVLATAAVQRVPYAWVRQTVPGGRIVAPWGTVFHNGALLRLRVGEDGTASGHFGGNVAFMWVRDQRPPHGVVREHVRPEHDYVETTTELHPYHALSVFDASFAIGLRVPEMTSVVVYDNDDPHGGAYTAYLMDTFAGSWASWRVGTGARSYGVRQHGARRLFDELATAYAWWEAAGKPPHTRFGLTVRPDGQTVWLDHPEHPIGSPSDVTGSARRTAATHG
ncbi:methyltransferase domain-containing protein [Marinactinospora rubrisoli]|uniref:Protein-L-isoaspartate O-methyltransferase n=1 Tax=Marinactinospora rubrisoli TaxID=2715399 RepID=A0ABW2KK54_9ACTN